MAVKLNKLAEQAVDKFPDGESRAIARYLVETYPDVFKNLESARAAVRRVRGVQGNYARKHASRPWEPGKPGEKWRELPTSYARVREPFTIPESRILILSDLHVPYHDIAAIELALDHYEFDCILINGDFLDFHRLSRFVSEPESVSFGNEIAIGRAFLEVLRDRYGVPIYYKLGNHEERLQDYMFSKAPEVAATSFWKLDELLELETVGATLIDDKRRILAGGLTILHGHELAHGMFGPVNPARGVYMKAGVSCLVGHHHRTSEHSGMTLDGSLVSCWSTGALCQLSMNYNPYPQSNHGFAFAEIDGDQYHVFNHRIFNGKVY